jgi:fructoselysine-6-phosphate deglycase
VNFAEDDTSSESFYLQSLLLSLAVLRNRGELPAEDHDRTLAELATLPALLLELKRGFEERAERLAAAFRDEPYHVVTGAGRSTRRTSSTARSSSSSRA